MLKYIGHFAIDCLPEERLQCSREPGLSAHADESRLIVHCEHGMASLTREVRIPDSITDDGSTLINFSSTAIQSPVIEWSRRMIVPGGKPLSESKPDKGRLGNVIHVGNNRYLCSFWVFYHTQGDAYNHLQYFDYDGNFWYPSGPPFGPPDNFKFEKGPRAGKSTAPTEGTITFVSPGKYFSQSAYIKDDQPLITELFIDDNSDSYRHTQLFDGTAIDDCLVHESHGGFVHAGKFYWLEKSGVQGWYGSGDMATTINHKMKPGPLNYPDVWQYSNKGYHASGEHGYTLSIKSIPLVSLYAGNRQAIQSQDVTKYVLNRKTGSANMGISAGKVHVKCDWGPLARQGNRVYSAEWAEPVKVDGKPTSPNQSRIHVHCFELPGPKVKP